jgi:hypothetical protein
LQAAVITYLVEARNTAISVVHSRPVVAVIEFRVIAVSTVLVEPLITMDAFIQTIVAGDIHIVRDGVVISGNIGGRRVLV